jgi:hypothetical protein
VNATGWGEHPMAPASRIGDASGMNTKTWPIEVAIAACLMAWAFAAFTLLLGQSLWLSQARK